MSKYSDCYPGCGGEDCPCCEIHIDHMQNYGRDQHYPRPRAASLQPCDLEDYCPFNAQGGLDCYNYCGVGADEDEE